MQYNYLEAIRADLEEIENMKRQITSNKVELVIKLPTNKHQGPCGFTGEYYQTFREELTPILLNLFQKIAEEGTLPNLFYEHQHYPDTKTRQRSHKERKLRPISLMNLNAKILNKVLANRIQQYIKRIIHHDKVRFIQGCKNF